MWRWVFRPLKMLVAVFTGGGSPRAVAFGFAFGMMIGLLPKGNLTAAALSVVVLSTRANLAAATLAGFLFSWLAVWTDPLAHRLGSAVLTQPAWQSWFVRVYELPLMPWTGLNNTVVLGSLLLAIVLFYPIYRLTWLAFDRHHARLADTLQQYHVEKVLAGAEAAMRWRHEQHHREHGGARHV
jgi:uncharacterized protein (TIGR03546 family)